MNQIASLSLTTYPDPTPPKIAANAVAIVKQIGASLHAVAITVDIPDVSNALSSYLLDLPNKIREVEAASRKCGTTLLQAVAREASQSGVTLTTQEITAPPALMGDVAAKESRYFDLCLVGWESDNQTARMAAEAILFGSGRPTIILPDAADIDVLGQVVIAWDGSRVAARAVADAQPFLERASAITVVTVTDEK
ncbi:MAG: universal stress protein, partial [Mesorhizobium sp.]